MATACMRLCQIYSHSFQNKVFVYSSDFQIIGTWVFFFGPKLIAENLEENFIAFVAYFRYSLYTIRDFLSLSLVAKG